MRVPAGGAPNGGPASGGPTETGPGAWSTAPPRGGAGRLASPALPKAGTGGRAAAIIGGGGGSSLAMGMDAPGPGPSGDALASGARPNVASGAPRGESTSLPAPGRGMREGPGAAPPSEGRTPRQNTARIGESVDRGGGGIGSLDGTGAVGGAPAAPPPRAGGAAARPGRAATLPQPAMGGDGTAAPWASGEATSP